MEIIFHPGRIMSLQGSVEMRELPLSDFGLETIASACARKGWVVTTTQKWVQRGLLPVVVVGSGRSAKHLLRVADVDGFTPPPRGRPKG
jgi:hypothetical protein